MNRPMCYSCVYWESYLNRDKNSRALGECHRNAPRSMLYVIGLVQADKYPPSAVSWPDTLEDEWCGEHPDFPAFVASLKMPMPPMPPKDHSSRTLGEVLEDEANWPPGATLPTRVINALRGGWNVHGKERARKARETPLAQIVIDDLLILNNFGIRSWADFTRWRGQILANHPDTQESHEEDTECSDDHFAQHLQSLQALPDDPSPSVERCDDESR